MKTIDVAEFLANVEHYLQEVRAESIVIIDQGKPCAVLHGIPEDLESAELSHSAEFWALIEQRRREPTIPWEEAKQELD